MKKILVVAALLATTVAVPATPSFAAAGTKTDVPAKCFILALLPECIAAWKAEGDAVKADMPVADMSMSMPAVDMKPLVTPWFDCQPASAGAGHMFDCAAAQ